MNSKQEANQTNKAQFVEPTIYMKGDYITLALPGNILVRKHVNYFKKTLGVPFIPKPRATQAQVSANPQIADPSLMGFSGLAFAREAKKFKKCCL